MNTNLVGVKVRAHYDSSGTIRAVYIDRGECKLVIQNPDGRLYTANAEGVIIDDEDSSNG